MTISPSDVFIVAVYRFAGSIPISGADGNCCRLGAEPSNGGNSIRRTLSRWTPQTIWARFFSRADLGAGFLTPREQLRPEGGAAPIDGRWREAARLLSPLAG